MVKPMITIWSFLIFIQFTKSINAINGEWSFKLISNDNQEINQINLFEGQSSIFNGSLSYFIFNDSLKNEKLFINCDLSYLKVGIIKNWTDIKIPTEIYNSSKLQFEVNLLAKRLGDSNLICSVKTKPQFNTLYQQILVRLIVARIPTVIELIFRIILIIFVILIEFLMGCAIDRHIVWQYLKKPISPLVGFSSQFLIMPLIAAGVAKISGIDKAFGLGLITVGCSPGGGSSNIWTVIFGGDLNLSMTMTFISSCAALGMMPLWLFILSRIFIDPNLIKVPYDNIIYNLLQVVIPVVIGIAFRWKWESKAKWLMKKAKLIGLLFVIYILTFGIYANFYIFELIGDYPYLLPIAATLPWLGFLFGFLLSLITRRNKEQCIAISLETGFQNVGIAIILLKYSMPQPEGDLGSVMAIIVSLFTPIPLYITYLIMIIKKKFFSKKIIPSNEIIVDSL